MDHPDHLALIRDGIPAPGGTWADLLGPQGRIWSVDRDARALREQEATLRARFPAVPVRTVVGDFRRPLDLPALDGALLANSLHFLTAAEKDTVLGLIRGYLRPGGCLVLVEYNTDRGNPWLPHPFSYPTWEMLARRNGFAATRLLARRPSRTFGEIYAALSERPDESGSTA